MKDDEADTAENPDLHQRMSAVNLQNLVARLCTAYVNITKIYGREASKKPITNQ